MTDDFALDVAKFVQGSIHRADQTLRKIAQDSHTGCIMKSPVDTGTFRGAWQVGVNEVNLSEGTADMFGTMSDGTAKINEAKYGDTIYITNNLPYAEALEHGHSKKAPNGVLHITVEKVKADLQSALRRMI